MASPPTLNDFTKSQRSGEIPITDIMGSQVVVIIVGKEQTEQITVHMNLLGHYAPAIIKMIKNTNTPIPILTLPDDDATIFKAFVEILYSRDVPRLTASMPSAVKSLHIRQLARLYTFLEKYHARFELRNKVMDRIQDGFALINVFPPSDFITAIYDNTIAGSPLRNFAASILVYRLRTEMPQEQLEHFGQFLARHPTIMKDFLAVTKGYVSETDPRVRNCKGEPGCTECEGNEEKMEKCKVGYWPCYFHLHTGWSHEGVIKIEDPGNGAELVIDGDCYLWDTTNVKEE